MALAWQPIDLAPADPHEAEHRGDPQVLVDAADALLALLRRPEWHRQAACRGQGTAAWFPASGEPAGPAKAVCAGCPVQRECLDAGLHEPHGTWGGTSPLQRRKLRREAA